MTDIVKVLRGEELFPCKANAVEEIRCGRGDCTCDMLKMEKAADEIERLREALLEIAEGDRPDNKEQFCVGYWGATARAVLEGKKE